MDAPVPTYDEVYPVCLERDRYSGVYSGGVWLAYPCDAHEVHPHSQGDDTEAQAWWDAAADVPIGRGSTIESAYVDLLTRLASRPPDTRRDGPDVRYPAWSWGVTWPGGWRSALDWDLGRGLEPGDVGAIDPG